MNSEESTNHFKKINEEYEEKILDLENKNKDLNERLKSKTASAIWANMQVQLQEKDKQIDDIKKELEFYKRKDLFSSTASNLQIRNGLHNYDKNKYKPYYYLLKNFQDKYEWLNQ